MQRSGLGSRPRVSGRLASKRHSRNSRLIFHIVSGVLFLVVWPLHMGLMLWHQLRKRDGQLNRMLPFTRQDAAGSERQAG